MALSDFLMASKMAQSRKDINAYSKKAGRAMGKQGRWAGFGRMLGSIGAPLAAAAMVGGPIGWAGAALATGVGSYLGGKWGREGAAKTKEGKVGKMKGGPSAWMQGSRETIKSDVADIRQYLKDSNITESVKAGAMAGIKVAGSDLTDALKAKIGGPALSASPTTPATTTAPTPPGGGGLSSVAGSYTKGAGATGAVTDMGGVLPSQQSAVAAQQKFLGSSTGGGGKYNLRSATPHYNPLERVPTPSTSTALSKPGIFSKEAMWGKGIQEGSPVDSLLSSGKGMAGRIGKIGEDVRGTLEDVWKGGGHVRGSSPGQGYTMRQSGLGDVVTDLKYEGKYHAGNIKEAAGQLRERAGDIYGGARERVEQRLQGAVGGAQDLWHGGKVTSTGAGQIGISGGISGIPTDIKYAAQGALSDLGEYGQRFGGQVRSGARGAASSMYDKWQNFKQGGQQYQGMDIRWHNPYR